MELETTVTRNCENSKVNRKIAWSLIGGPHLNISNNGTKCWLRLVQRPGREYRLFRLEGPAVIHTNGQAIFFPFFGDNEDGLDSQSAMIEHRQA